MMPISIFFIIPALRANCVELLIEYSSTRLIDFKTFRKYFKNVKNTLKRDINKKQDAQQSQRPRYRVR